MTRSIEDRAYIVVFDDGRYLGMRGPVFEYPDAQMFTSKRKAEQAARAVNLPSSVAATDDYT